MGKKKQFGFLYKQSPKWQKEQENCTNWNMYKQAKELLEMINQLEMKLIKAIFNGKNESCGYDTGKEYTLMVFQNIHTIRIENKYASSRGDGYCEYSSIISFFENWDNIRVVKEEKRVPLFVTEDGVEIFEKGKYFYLSTKLDEIFVVDSAIKYFLSEGIKRFSTEQAAKDWIATQKPKSLKPEELVDGEIYVAEEDGRLIFRHKSFRRYEGHEGSVHCYTLIGFGLAGFSRETWTMIYSPVKPRRICRHATLSEKQTLIHTEVENGYYYELKNQK